MLRPNFDKTVFKEGSVLFVSGPGEFDPEMQLVSRSVALQQPPRTSQTTQYIAGPAPLSSKWTAKLTCRSDPPEFVAGEPILGIGTETYFVGSPDNPSAPATFVTVTWSEELELEDR